MNTVAFMPDLHVAVRRRKKPLVADHEGLRDTCPPTGVSDRGRNLCEVGCDRQDGCWRKTDRCLEPPKGTLNLLSAPSPPPLARSLALLDRGDRHLEVLHAPGHSPGSIALFEAASGVLFSSDTVYHGPRVTDAWHSWIDDYVLSMEHRLALPVRVVHAGHFPSFGGARYRALVRSLRDVRRA